MVRTFWQFKSSAVLLVSEKSAVKIGNFYKTRAAVPWRGGIAVDVADPIKVLSKLNHILEQADFLAIKTFRRTDKLPSGSLTKLLHVLRTTCNLSYLQIDIRLMYRNLFEVFSFPAVQSNLKNLNSFQILYLNSETGKFERSLNRVSVFGSKLSFIFHSWLRDTDPIVDSAEYISVSAAPDEIFEKI